MAENAAEIRKVYEVNEKNINCCSFNANMHCYYLIDYYDFSFYDVLDEMNMLGLTRSYELYGYAIANASWKKNAKKYYYWFR